MALVAGAIALVTLVALTSFTPSSTPRAPPAPVAVLPDAGTLAGAVASLRSGAGPAAGHPLACQPLLTGPTARCGPAAAPTAHAGWEQLGTTPQDSGWLAFDAADHYAVFLGAAGGGGSPTPQTWTYASNGWTELPPLTTPAYCGGAAVTYDSWDKYVLLLEGANCTDQGQTWTFSAGVWAHVTTSVSPRNVSFPALTDDPAASCVVLFGGALYSGPVNETWTYSAGTWTNQTPFLNLSPPARQAAAFAYDAADGNAVLFGGSGLLNGFLNDTWEFHYSGGKFWWTAGPTSGAPPPRAFATFAPTPSGNLTLYAGAGYSVTYHSFVYNDSWRFAGGTWHALSANPLGGGRQEIAPYDSAGDLIAVDAPGYTGYFPPYSGAPAITWNWSATTSAWTNLTPAAWPTPQISFAPALVYDAADGYVVMFGSEQIQFSSGEYHFLPVTWSYRGGTWTNLTNRSTQPLGRIDEGLVYDAADGYVLMFGGEAPYACGPTNGYPACGDTWEFAGGLWRQLSTSTAPSNRSNVPMAYDAADGYVVLTGGTCPGASVYSVPHLCNDTWRFTSGNWTNITTTSGPQPNAGYGQIAYDSHDGYVLELTYPNYTSTFVGGKWTNRTGTVGPGPLAVGGATLVDDPAMGYVLWDRIVWPPPTYPQPWDFNWAYQNGTWTNVTGPTPVPTDVAVADTYDGADHYVLRMGVVSTVNSNSVVPYANGLSPYWNWTNVTGGAGGGFAITGFTASPPVVDVGAATTFTVTYTGGTSPYNFTYTGLPRGCAGGTTNSSSLRCVPTTTGTFDVSVVAADAHGNRSAASVTVQVNSVLALTGFAATPANLTLGSRTLLDVSSVGGTGPWSYAYGGLPAGCATQSIPLLPCQPTAAGNFTVNVTVTDASSTIAFGTLTLRVTAAGGHGAPTITSFAAVPSAFVLGNSTNVTVAATGASPLTYAYTGLPTGCAGSNTSAFACTPTVAGTFTVDVTVVDAHHNTTTVGTNVTVYPVGGGAGLAVTAFGAQPGTLTVNTTTLLEVVATGGRGPLTYAYSGLPPGCASIDTPSLPCAPTRTGTFNAAVQVVDSSGDHAGVRAIIEVIASAAVLPQVSAFVATPARVDVNASLTLFVAVGGGVLPFSYAFTGLPAGCSTVNGPVLECYPTTAGNYTVSVNVTDAAGHPAHATTGVEVVAVPGPGTLPGKTTPANGAPAWIAAATDAGGAIVGAALVAALAVVWDRQRRRREGEALVAELDAERSSDHPTAPP